MNQTIQKTIEYLNHVADTDYTPDFPPTVEMLTSLINQGYGLHDFKTVIDKKWKSWKGTKYQDYIRPSTLFGSKFENYLNERPSKSPIEQLADSVQRAKQTNWRLDKR